jgi:hypothetical protein
MNLWSDMADNIGFMIFYTLAELLSGMVNCILRKLGYPEITVKKLSVIIGWIFVALGVIFLIAFTVKYS